MMMSANEVVYRVGPIAVSYSQLLYVGCLFSSYGFSYVYYAKLLSCKTEWVKHLYIAAVANLFLVVNFPLLDVVRLYTPILLTYFFARCFRRSELMPFWNFVIVLTYLAYFHLRRQFLTDSSPDLYVLDITGPLMMLVIKLTSFAFDARDAYVWSTKRLPQLKSAKPLDSNHDVGNATPRTSTKHSRDPLVETAQKFSVLKRYPSLLEFLGYSLLFPGLLTGPTLPFYEYRTFIDGSYFSGVDMTSGSLAGRKRRASYLLIISLFFMAIYACFHETFSPRYLVSPEFAALSSWRKVIFVHATQMVSRSKYYFAWLVAEGSYVIIGLGFRMAPSMKPLWDRLENVNPFRIESNTDFKLLISQWNQCTNQWLHTYVYQRFRNYYGKETSSARASVITYLVSAFWHGFYPGYYLSFVTAAMMTITSRMIYRTVHWPFGGFSRRLLLYIPLHIVIDYMTTPFLLLDFTRSLAFWRECYFLGHLSMILSLVVLYVFYRERSPSLKKVV